MRARIEETWGMVGVWTSSELPLAAEAETRPHLSHGLDAACSDRSNNTFYEPYNSDI